LDDGKIKNEDFALNEVVVERRTPYVVKLDLYINDTFATTFASDGVLISTSTGSTAYNLSLGHGIILHPNVNCMIVNPMSPISLSARPLVLPKDAKVSIKVEIYFIVAQQKFKIRAKNYF
jgi:NAD kinase